MCHLAHSLHPLSLLASLRYVHYQCSISVEIPPYWDKHLSAPHMVELSLVDTSQGVESAPVEIVYHPNVSF